MNEKKLRILLAEGNPGEASSALRILYPEGQDGLELTHVSSVPTLVATLDIVNPEIIFLDLALAQPNALDVVRRVHRSAPAVPVVLLSEASGKGSLCEVAKLLAASCRRTDIVARLGEAQFAALAVDAVEPSAPVLRKRLEKRVLMLNRDVRPWGPLELRMSARFWSAKEAMVFSEFLGIVEAGLRVPLGPSSPETPPAQKI